MIIGEWLTAGICMAMSETFRKFDEVVLWFDNDNKEWNVSAYHVVNGEPEFASMPHETFKKAK